MKSKYSTLFILGTLFLCAKIFYKYAKISQLLWLVKPVAIWISLLTNAEMYWDDSSGYVFPSHGICIEKSCSGYNLLLICFSMLSYLILQFRKNISKLFAWILACILSYVVCIISNSVRIILSILFSTKLPSLWIPYREMIHQGIGVFTNILFLIITFLFFQYLFKTTTAHEKSA